MLFFQSSYIFDRELPAIKRRYQRDKHGVAIFPIILEPCLWRAFVGHLQVIPTGTGEKQGRAVPVIEWNPERHGYDAIRDQLEEALCTWFGLTPVAQW
jgi:hypothetical protein